MSLSLMNCFMVLWMEPRPPHARPVLCAGSPVNFAVYAHVKYLVLFQFSPVHYFLIENLCVTAVIVIVAVIVWDSGCSSVVLGFGMVCSDSLLPWTTVCRSREGMMVRSFHCHLRTQKST